MILLLGNAFAQIKVVTAHEEIMAELQYFFNTNLSGFVWKQHQIVQVHCQLEGKHGTWITFLN